jgi:hypothetical protein
VWVADLRQWVHLDCKSWACKTCGKRKSRETARLLLLDACLTAPTHAITLTTRQPWDQLDPETYRQASAAVWKRLRRHYGRVEYCGMIEFTTGQAARSGGHRRMHGHYLVKFSDQEGVDVIEVERLVRETWEAVTGAYRIEVAALITPGAAMAYLGLHHQKPQQQPPAGWRGIRFRASQGYWSMPVATLRAAAKLSLREEAVAWAKSTGEPRRLAARTPSPAAVLR